MKIKIIICSIVAFCTTHFKAQQYVSTSPDSVCAGAQNVVYRIPPPANQNSVYNWSVTGAATFTNQSAPVNDSIYVNWPATPGVDFVQVFQSIGPNCVGPQAQLEVRRYVPSAVLLGSGSICQGNALNGAFTINFSGRAPFSVTYQFSDGVTTIGPFTINGITSSSYEVNLPVLNTAGIYTGSILSASDRSCTISSVSGNPVLNVFAAPPLPIIQHLD
jgi:hypothetical protein